MKENIDVLTEILQEIVEFFQDLVATIKEFASGFEKHWKFEHDV